MYSREPARKANVRATCPPSSGAKSVIGSENCCLSRTSTCSESTAGRKSAIKSSFFTCTRPFVWGKRVECSRKQDKREHGCGRVHRSVREPETENRERPTWLLLPTSITNPFSSHAKN